MSFSLSLSMAFITPYAPQFEEQMSLARKFMRDRRDALRELAK
jgi:hypothetical protein